MATFNPDPVPHEKTWTIQWKNNLSKLVDKLRAWTTNAEAETVTISDTLVLEGDGIIEGSLDIEEDLSVQDAAVSGELTVGEDLEVGGYINGVNIGGTLNITGASSDYSLGVGEVVRVDINNTQSTALRVAVTDGVYDMICLFDYDTFSADRAITLEINNTTFSAEFAANRFAASTGFATDEVDTSDGTLSAHHMAFGLAGATTMTPYRIDSRLTIFGTRSTLFSDGYGTSGGTLIQNTVRSTRNGSPAHTSLGTLNLGEAATAVVYIHRLA